MTGPSSATGGSTIFTLEPSLNLVSTIGTDSFTILLDNAAIFLAMWSNLSLSSKCLSHFNKCPLFSINILSAPFTIISVILSSSRSSCNIPIFLMALNTCVKICSLSFIEIFLTLLYVFIHSSIIFKRLSSSHSTLSSIRL